MAQASRVRVLLESSQDSQEEERPRDRQAEETLRDRQAEDRPAA